MRHLVAREGLLHVRQQGGVIKEGKHNMAHKIPTRKQTRGIERRRYYDSSAEGPGVPGEFPCGRWHLKGTFQNAESLHGWEGVGKHFMPGIGWGPGERRMHSRLVKDTE